MFKPKKYKKDGKIALEAKGDNMYKSAILFLLISFFASSIAAIFLWIDVIH